MSSTTGLPEDKAYMAHHFNCKQCCAAGISNRKQKRCPDGLALWKQYAEAIKQREQHHAR